MSVAALVAALSSAGIACSVEPRDRLAVLVPPAGSSLFADADARRTALGLARAHGFTHIAVELIDESVGAPLSRD